MTDDKTSENTNEIDQADQSDEFTIEKEGEEPKDTIKRLREKLKETVAKKQEYLDGWQRAKANLVNNKKDVAEAKTEARKQAEIDVIEDILPVLDSFQMAQADTDVWESVDEQWKEGVKQIESQLEQVLETHGVEAIDPASGDAFDPQFHNSVDTVAEKGKEEDTIAEVQKRGFKKGEQVIRSANVVVYT
jgi:molecular chaperone GrpE